MPGTETEMLGCLWPWSIRRSFISNPCLSLSDVSWHRLSCQFTKKNVIGPLPLSRTQSNRTFPRVVQVARLWDETEALLASTNVLITTLTWCSSDNSEASCAHQSAGKWRHGRSVQAAWGASIPRRASDICTSDGFSVLYKRCRCVIIGEKQHCEVSAGSAWLARKHSTNSQTACKQHHLHMM